jgi:uncharacterized protein YecE (DUF72 family)
MAIHSNVRVGTSGWSYPAGRGTWTGVFYPPRDSGRGRPKLDELAFYAERFDTVEVNSSFYRPPTPATTRGWVERTPPGFEFSLKLYQKFTHPEMFQKATGQDPFALGQADVDEFRAALDPLVEAGKLGALLAQFPPSFHHSPDSTAYLEWLLSAFREFPVAVELRHRSWSDEADATRALLAGYGAAWARIDEPKFKDSIRQGWGSSGPGLYYLRLHGRNAAQWWTHEAPEDRYDYLYTETELAPIAAAATEAAPTARKAYVYLNNHFAAKSVANAVILKHQLGQPVPENLPEPLLRQYPEAARVIGRR